MTTPLTHFDASGHATMVDVSSKPDTHRTATARARVVMAPATLTIITSGTAAKGDVLGVARLAGIMAAKRTSDLIPLCHPLMLTKVSVDLIPAPPTRSKSKRRSKSPAPPASRWRRSPPRRSRP